MNRPPRTNEITTTGKGTPRAATAGSVGSRGYRVSGVAKKEGSVHSRSKGSRTSDASQKSKNSIKKDQRSSHLLVANADAMFLKEFERLSPYAQQTLYNIAGRDRGQISSGQRPMQTGCGRPPRHPEGPQSSTLKSSQRGRPSSAPSPVTFRKNSKTSPPPFK